jgi:hypothetical protein
MLRKKGFPLYEEIWWFLSHNRGALRSSDMTSCRISSFNNGVKHIDNGLTHCKDTNYNTENSKQIFPICVCERFIYSHNRSAYSGAGKYVDRSWEYINHSQTNQCGNWHWGRAIPFMGIHKWDFRCSAKIKSAQGHQYERLTPWMFPLVLIIWQLTPELRAQISEPVLLNVYGASELIPRNPRNEFRQPM